MITGPDSVALVDGEKARVDVEQARLTQGFLTNAEATQKGINASLNVALLTLQELLEHPELLLKIPPAQRIELLFKAMRAQDSRISALKSVREDNREQARFERAFENAAYNP